MWKVSPGPTADYTPSPIEIKIVINMFIYVLYLCYKGDLGPQLLVTEPTFE